MKNWIWLHPDTSETPEKWKRQFNQFRQAGIDAILPCLYTGSQAFYNSGHLPVAGEILEGMLPIAKATGLELHVWMIALRCNIPQIQKEHPEWFCVSRNGESSLKKPPYVGYYQWLCPSVPDVSHFVNRTVAELASYDQLDGIHLNYIRHPDVILPAALQPEHNLVQDREYPEFDFAVRKPVVLYFIKNMVLIRWTWKIQL